VTHRLNSDMPSDENWFLATLLEVLNRPILWVLFALWLASPLFA
jgi:hypothetical protein